MTPPEAATTASFQFFSIISEWGLYWLEYVGADAAVVQVGPFNFPSQAEEWGHRQGWTILIAPHHN